MPGKIITEISGSVIPFPEKDVDTDQISPTMESLYILRWDELADVFCVKRRRKESDHVLNDPNYSNANILFAGENFGCGSSREHAPQAALARYDALVAISYAPIFGENAYSIGLPAVTVTPKNLDILSEIVKTQPKTNFKINLENRLIEFNGQSIPFELDEARRKGFLEGTWDEAEQLVAGLEANLHKIKNLPSVSGQYPAII